jgi:phosphate transport system permease protein
MLGNLRMKRDFRKRRKMLAESFQLITGIGAFMVIVLFSCLIFSLLSGSTEAFKTFGLNLITQMEWNPVEGREKYGLLAPIWGTLYSSFLALSLAIPVAIGMATFLQQDILPKKLRTGFIFAIEILAAIPSVVYGLWGIFVVVPLIGSFGGVFHHYFGWLPIFHSSPQGPNLLAASFVLAIMVLPIITAFTIEALNAVPQDIEMASYAMGATRWETVFKVLLPVAAPGVLAGIALALGRALGETMAITMICGNAFIVSLSVFDPATTLSSLIANQFAEASGLASSALYAAALVLFAISILVNGVGLSITATIQNSKKG